MFTTKLIDAENEPASEQSSVSGKAAEIEGDGDSMRA